MDLFYVMPGTMASTNDKQWEMAKKYFRANINCEEVLSGDDINNCIENFNDIAYNYFAENHGKVDSITDNKKELIQKYKDFSKQQDQNATPASFQYVSKLLCCQIKLPSLKA